MKFKDSGLSHKPKEKLHQSLELPGARAQQTVWNFFHIFYVAHHVSLWLLSSHLFYQFLSLWTNFLYMLLYKMENMRALLSSPVFTFPLQKSSFNWNWNTIALFQFTK